ncbi:MAG TPA: condensation domain-containing protein, partial [Segetibacter sp.]
MLTDTTSLEYTGIDFDPFAGPQIVAVAPATESQREIWISCVLGGDNASKAFNESVSLKFTGEVDKDKLEKALHDLRERHELLRCAFSGDGKQICIFENQYHELLYEDVSHLTIEQKEELIANEAQQEVLHVFDLLNGPLFISKLVKLSPDNYLLTLTAHHIVCDGWSISLIMQELGKLYSAHVQNIPVHLSPSVSFNEYANDKAIFYNSKEYKTIEDYWIKQYKENIPAVNLTTDFPRPAVRNYASTRLDFKVDAQLTLALKQLSNKSGCSFVTTLISGFEVFLHLLTGSDSLVLGLPAADQAATGHYNLVGHCVNLLPLKSYVDSKSSFNNYLKLRKKEILDSFDHQQFTFGSLLKKLNIPRDASRVALVPVVFNVDMGMNDGVSFHGLRYEFISNPRAFETFEIFLNISGAGDALTFEWSYNTQLFKAETIGWMMDGFKSVLKTVVENPEITIAEINLNDKKGVQDKLKQSNTPAVSYPRNKPAHYLIDETAAKFPTKTAIVFGDRKINYKQVNETANQVAHYLIDKGIKAGDVVGVAIDRSPDMLVSILAVMKSGAAYLPLDMIYPNGRIRFMLEDTAAECIITNKKYGGNFRAKEFFIEDVLSASVSYSKDSP